MRELKDKVAIITGAGRGIGQGVSLHLAEAGARLVLNDLDEAPLQATVKQCQGKGAQAVGVAGSVNDPALGGRLALTAVEKFGDIHIVVTCAGFTWDAVLHRMTDEQWQTIIDTHLTGTFRVVREAVKEMRERAKAAQAKGETPAARHIVTISSRSAYGNFGQANYSAAKGGIIGFTRTVAIEGAMFNILANSIAFGMIDTRLTREKEAGEKFQDRIALGVPKEARERHIQEIPLRRPGTVDEAVGPIVFLCSDESNYITGQVFHVNGGSRI